MIRLSLLLFLALLVAPLEAEPWRDETYGCAVNLPDSAGWQPISAPEIPGIKTLAAMQNPRREAVFGVTVLTNPPRTNLSDPATVKTIEDMLHGFGYQFFGNSTSTIGGIQWRQYPVTSTLGGRPISGVVRYAAANQHIFGVTTLLGGGKEAAQDPELQTAAISVRFFAPPAAPAPAPPVATSTAPAGSSAEPASSAPAPSSPAPKTESGPDYVRLGIFAGVGLLLLLIVIKLIGGGGAPPPVRPPGRR